MTANLGNVSPFRLLYNYITVIRRSIFSIQCEYKLSNWLKQNHQLAARQCFPNIMQPLQSSDEINAAWVLIRGININICETLLCQ